MASKLSQHKEIKFYHFPAIPEMNDIKLFHHDKNSFIILERNDYVKYLEILIDSNLTWKQHILFIPLKTSKSLGILSRLRHFVPTDTLVSIYRSLILPHITFGIAV